MKRSRIEIIAADVVDSCVAVHRELGAGLLESLYQTCLERELRSRGLFVQSEYPVDVLYKGETVDIGFRVNLMIEGAVIVENKCVQTLLPVHEAQLLTYFRLTHCRIGFLVNWNVLLTKDGIRRMVLGL